MPRYHFNVHDGVLTPDIEGTVLAGLPQAKREAARLAGQLLITQSESYWNGEQWTVETTDFAGAVLFKVTLQALDTVPLPRSNGAPGAFYA